MYLNDNLSTQENKAIEYIRNLTLHTGRSPSIRELGSHLGYKSSRSPAILVNKLVDKGILARRSDGQLRIVPDAISTPENAFTTQVPLVGSVACGAPLLAEENIEAMIPVSTKIANPSQRYFFLRAVGDSMNQAGIQDGDLVLIRQQSAAESGEKVVALIDDEATIKTLSLQDGAVVLQPKSSNPVHKPIILDREFEVQGVVVQTLTNI